MGDAADDAFDDWIAHGAPSHIERKNKFQNVPSYQWRTSEDTVLNMRDMDTSHIENAIIKCIEYGNKNKLSELRQVLEERNLPDDGYQDYLKRIGQI